MELDINSRHPAVAQKVEWATVSTPAGRSLAYTIPRGRDGPPRVAELCSGAVGPFTVAARALGMEPAIEVDRDIARGALLRITRQVLPRGAGGPRHGQHGSHTVAYASGADNWTIGAPAKVRHMPELGGEQVTQGAVSTLSGSWWPSSAPYCHRQGGPGGLDRWGPCSTPRGLADHPYAAYVCAIEASAYIPHTRTREALRWSD